MQWIKKSVRRGLVLGLALTALGAMGSPEGESPRLAQAAPAVADCYWDEENSRWVCDDIEEPQSPDCYYDPVLGAWVCPVYPGAL